MNLDLWKVGKYIKDSRQQKDLSQRDLADLTGISFSYVSALERGKHIPSRDKLIKLAEVLNLDQDKLFTLAGYATGTIYTNNNVDSLPVNEVLKLPVIGSVKAGPNGLAFEEYIGYESVDQDDISGGNYFYLKVKGDSMINDGILPGDYVLVREQNDIDYGELAIVIIDNEEGTLKRVYKQKNSIMLQSSNPSYPPRVFEGKEMEQIHIIGKVKGLKRKF